MGIFVFPPPNLPHNDAQINMITSSTFKLGVPWKVPLESVMILYGNEMLCGPFELAYEEIQCFSNSSTFDND